MSARETSNLLDHLISARQQRRHDCQAERLRRLEVDDQFELRRLLDGRSAGLAPLRILSTYAAPRRDSSVMFAHRKADHPAPRTPCPATWRAAAASWPAPQFVSVQ